MHIFFHQTIIVTYDISYVMPHVSKKKLNNQQIKRLEKELANSFEQAAANMKTADVFYEFFTFTEKIMFAKRLAVITMLKKGVSNYMISQALHMSPSTVERMSLNYEKGKYNNILKQALGRKNVWNIIENILDLGGILPPKFGKGRWRMLDK